MFSAGIGLALRSLLSGLPSVVWKVLGGITLVVLAYEIGLYQGAASARDKARVATLEANLNELHRQHAEANAVIAQAQKQSDEDAAVISQLNSKVDDYVGKLSKVDACILSGADALRLREFD